MDTGLISTERIDIFLRQNEEICEEIALHPDSVLAHGYMRLICTFLSCETQEEFKAACEFYSQKAYITFISKPDRNGRAQVFGLGGK